MGAWTEAVDAKARIIHAQMGAARALAERGGHDPNTVDKPYLELLAELYREEYLFAEVMDNSDLVARFEGPAVAAKVPTLGVVTSMCFELRKQIQHVTKAIVGLATDKRTRWPALLDPRLSGMAPGSLVVGVSIQAGDLLEAQATLPEVSTSTLQAVKDAVQSISAITQHVRDDGLDDAIYEHCPDPAVRDTVVVAASKLAPTGRRGIDRLSLYGPEVTGMEARPLTPKSRMILKAVVSRPVRVADTGKFEGVVRAIDLDARRFEIRGVSNVGAIRCIYSASEDQRAKTLLDKRVAVEGDYEVQSDHRPRLIQVSKLTVDSATDNTQPENLERQARMRAAIASLIGSVHDESLQADESSWRVGEILAEKHARSQERH